MFEINKKCNLIVEIFLQIYACLGVAMRNKESE